MRQLLLNKGNLVVKELAQPLLSDHSLLVAVHYTYISSNTTVTKINTEESFFSNIPHKVKRVLESVAGSSRSDVDTDNQITNGYSCAGHVVSVGKKVKNFAPGDFIACVDLGYLPHSDLACVPEYGAVRVTNEAYLKAASLTGLATYALQGVRRAQLQIGDRVCVFGLDIVGLLTVQLAKLAGCLVIGIDTEATRLEVAKKLGADTVFHLSRDDIYKEINLMTERHGADISFVVSSTDHAIDHAIAVSRAQGKIVLFGSANMSSVQKQRYTKDVDILIASGLHLGQKEVDETPARWTENKNMEICEQMIEQGKLQLAPLLEEEISIKQIKQTYQRIQKKLIVGAVLAYKQIAFSQASSMSGCHTGGAVKFTVQTDTFVPAVSDQVRVGVIGVGTFAQQTLLPLLAKLRNVSVKAVVDSDVRKARVIAKRYGNVKTFVKAQDLFANNLIDVAVIASAHTVHAEHALRALQSGKAVLLEKPMVTDFSQLQRLCSFLRKNQHAPFCVDYHYPFAPFSQKIKAVVKKRRTPMMIHYRVNRELMRSDRIRSTMKAGYILGDASQIVDLFCYLTDARPVSIAVEAMHSSRDDIFPTDNVSVQISFSEGSVCTLLYTVLGHAGMGAERMEIFYDEKAILMEDYMELYGFGLPAWFNETITVPDNGHERLVSQFFNSLKDESLVAPIDPDRLHMIAEVSLLIDQLACEGGGKKEL